MPYYNTKINEVNVNVYAEVHGEYYPATHDDPEEFPEVVIQEIWCNGEELPDAFYQVFVNEINVIECAIQYGDLEPDHD